MQERYWLSIFWIFGFVGLWTVVAGLKLHFDPVHYQTTDGGYYQELRHDLEEGRPMVLDGLRNRLGKSFSPYPPGYPILLSLGEHIPGIPFFPSHLRLHALLLFLVLLVWSRFFPLWPMVFLAFGDTLMELGCYPWSEFSFLTFLILATLVVTRLETRPSRATAFLAAVLLVFSFLVRYAAVFTVPFLLMKNLVHRKSAPEKARGFWLVALLFLSVPCLVAVWEWVYYGHLTGCDRYPNHENTLALFYQLVSETGNQLLLFKDMQGSSSFSFFAGLAGMGLLALLLLFGGCKENQVSNGKVDPEFREAAARNLIWMGLLYFGFIILARWYFYFAESFDLRLLAPGFSLLWLGFFAFLANRFRFRMVLVIPVFLAFSVFLSLPKRPMVEAWQEKIWMHTSLVFGQ